MSDYVVMNLEPRVANVSIGLIGAGRMGVGMGANLLRNGALLNIKGNNKQENIARLVDMGAHTCSSIKEMAENAKIVLLALPSSVEVESVCLGSDGLIENLRADSVIIDTSTSDPSSTIKIANEAKKYGVKFVDAPVTRSPKEAELGTLNSIIGTDMHDREFVTHIVAAYSEAVIYAGEVGSAHRLKLLNNSLSMGMVALVTEACQLARKMDIDIGVLRALVGRGATNNGVFQAMCSFLLGEDDKALNFSILNASKDIRYVVSLAEKYQCDVPVLRNISNKFGNAVANGFGDCTLPHLVEASMKA